MSETNRRYSSSSEDRSNDNCQQYNFEDEVDIVTLPRLDVMVVMSPGQRESQVKERLLGHVESYITACSSAAGSKPNASRYLRLLPGCVPLREVHVGQSSYRSSILPVYASAFAFDSRAIDSWTPTVQVLGQAMSSEFGVPVAQALDILANNYLLAPRGLAFINVVPYESYGAQLHIKLESRVAELLSNMVVSSLALGSARVMIIEYGDDAKMAGDAFWASMKSASLPVSRVSVRNPVWVSRNFPCYSTSVGPGVSTLTSRLCSRYLHHKANSPDSGLRRQPWRHYTKSQLSHVRPQVTMRLMSSLVHSESIEQIEASFAKLVDSMPHRRPHEDESGDDEPESYVNTVLRQIGEESSRQVATTEEALKLAKNAVSKCTKDNRESVEAMVAVLRSCVDAQVMASGFFASLPSTLSSDTAALSVGVSTLPPIVRAYTSSRHIDPRSAGLNTTSGTTMATSRPKLSLKKLGRKSAPPTVSHADKQGKYKGKGKAWQLTAVEEGEGTEREPPQQEGSVASAVVVGSTVDDDMYTQDPFSDYARSPSSYEHLSPGLSSVGLRQGASESVSDGIPFEGGDYAMEEELTYPSVSIRHTGNVARLGSIGRDIYTTGRIRAGPSAHLQQQQQQQQQHQHKLPVRGSTPRDDEPGLGSVVAEVATTVTTTPERKGEGATGAPSPSTILVEATRPKSLRTPAPPKSGTSPQTPRARGHGKRQSLVIVKK